MTRKQRRLALIGTSLAVLAVAAALVLSALRESIVFFNSPTDVAEKPSAPGTRRMTICTWRPYPCVSTRTAGSVTNAGLP